MRGGIFSRPVLKFKWGTAITPYEGFKMGLKPLKGPHFIEMCALVRRDLKEECEEFLNRLINGIHVFRGFEEWFDCVVACEEIVVDENREYLDAAGHVDADVVLAVIPDEMAVEYEEDPYMPLKRELSMRGIPSQMVTFSTVKYLGDKGYVLFNLALNIYAKAGGIPWALAEELYFDTVVGLDVGGGNIVVASLGKSIEEFHWRRAFNPQVEVAVSLKDILLDTLVALSEKRELKRVVIHRDGIAFPHEVEVVRDVFSELKYMGYDVPLWAFVEVKKRAIPRILRSIKGGYKNPVQGVYVELDPFKYIVATVGYPEHPLLSHYGVARPLVVELVETSNWELEFRRVVRDIYWLSQLNWASGLLPSRLPISTLYPHRIISFLRAGVHPPDEFMRRMWFL